MHHRLALVALTLLVAGCSSGGSSGSGSVPTLPANGAPQAGGTANAQVSIVIPALTAAQALRRAQYISPSTQSLSFAAATGSPVVVALTPTSPGCTSGTSGTTCTVNVPLPVGANQQFVVATYANTAGTGTALSTNKITASIVAGQANPISISLGGVPATVALVVTSPVPSVAATSVPVTVNVKDAAGNTIVGSQPFSDANGNAVTIALADSDTTGATTLSPATLTAPGNATLAYDNYFQPTSVTLSAGSSTVTTATAQIAFTAKPIIFAYAAGAENGTADPVTFGPSTGIESQARRGATAARRNVQSYNPTTGIQRLGNLLLTSSTSAPYSLGTNSSSSSTGFGNLNDVIYDYGTNQLQTMPGVGMATAPNGHAYFTEWYNNQPGIFDAGTTPAWPAGSSIVAGPFGPLALGPGGKVFVGINGGFEQINPATGAAIGAAVTVPGTFTQTVPNAITVGSDGTVYIEAFETTSGDDDVLAFAPTGAGFTFNRSFSTANSHLSSDAIYGLAIDAANNVYISADQHGTLDIVPASSQGEVLPSRVITTTHNIGDGINVLIDRAGNVIWATWATVSIYAPGSGTAPPPGNPATPWTPSTDTTALQTLTDTVTRYNDAFMLLSFGPGS